MREVPQGDGDTLTFGAYLKSSRSLRDLSLEEVATATRLPARIVAALESGDYATLRDKAHALLVARSVAAAIGLDPEETALRLEEELQRLQPGVVERKPLLRRLWEARPRDNHVWIVLLITLVACAALFLRSH